MRACVRARTWLQPNNRQRIKSRMDRGDSCTPQTHLLPGSQPHKGRVVSSVSGLRTRPPPHHHHHHLSLSLSLPLPCAAAGIIQTNHYNIPTQNQISAEEPISECLLTCTQSSQHKCTSQPGQPHISSSQRRSPLRRQPCSCCPPGPPPTFRRRAPEESRVKTNPSSGGAACPQSCFTYRRVCVSVCV